MPHDIFFGHSLCPLPQVQPLPLIDFITMNCFFFSIFFYTQIWIISAIFFTLLSNIIFFDHSNMSTMIRKNKIEALNLGQNRVQLQLLIIAKNSTFDATLKPCRAGWILQSMAWISTHDPLEEAHKTKFYLSLSGANISQLRKGQCALCQGLLVWADSPSCEWLL